MSWRKWKLGVAVTIFLSAIVAGSGYEQGMHFAILIKVFCTALLTHFLTFLKDHPTDAIDFGDGSNGAAGTDKNPSNMNKTLSLLLAALLGGLILSACTSPKPGQSTGGVDPKVTDLLINVGISDAISAGVVAAVISEPDSLAYVQAADAAMIAFGGQDDLSPQALITALSNLNVKELQTKEGRALTILIVQKYRSHYQALVGQGLNATPRLKQVLSAITEGLSDGVTAAQLLQATKG
jgi:hypothetical protein